MARITFAKDQPIQSLSGTIGRISYRTRNGRTFVYRTDEPVLPKNPTRKQREKFKQQTVVNYCVTTIQEQIPDLPKALAMRTTIRDRVLRLYKLLSSTTKAQTKLQKSILDAYYRRFCESEPRDNRDITETKPRQSRGHHKKSKRP